jgi:hypothetical protein
MGDDFTTKTRPAPIESWPISETSVRTKASVAPFVGLCIADNGIHQRDCKAWANPPSKPMLDRDCRHMHDAEGKPRWSPVITFIDRRTHTAWGDEVIVALRSGHPRVLA